MEAITYRHDCLLKGDRCLVGRRGLGTGNNITISGRPETGEVAADSRTERTRTQRD